MNTINDMTLEELRHFIRTEISRYINFEADQFELADDAPLDVTDPETLQALFDEIDDDMWTPPPGTPSVVELIRADRDSA